MRRAKYGLCALLAWRVLRARFRRVSSIVAVLIAAGIWSAGLVSAAPSAQSTVIYLPAVPHEVDDEIPFEAREAVLNAIEMRVEGMVNPDSLEERAALADYLETLDYFEAVGLESDGSVWARFTDGRLYVLAATPRPGRVPALAAPTARSPLSSSPMSNGGESDTAFVMTAMGPCFNRPGYESPIADISTWLTAKNYRVITDAPTVDFLKSNIQGARIFHIEGHGGIARARDRTLYAVWTATSVTAANDRKYRQDLRGGRLVYPTDGWNSRSSPLPVRRAHMANSLPMISRPVGS